MNVKQVEFSDDEIKELLAIVDSLAEFILTNLFVENFVNGVFNPDKELKGLISDDDISQEVPTD